MPKKPNIDLVSKWVQKLTKKLKLILKFLATLGFLQAARALVFFLFALSCSWAIPMFHGCPKHSKLQEFWVQFCNAFLQKDTKMLKLILRFLGVFGFVRASEALLFFLFALPCFCADQFCNGASKTLELHDFRHNSVLPCIQ